jgi:hypothetical protein
VTAAPRRRRWAGAGPALALTSGPVRADDNPNGLVFRAVGWFKGKAEITAGRINCEIPPDANNPYASPCGGWLQLQSNLIDQGLVVERIDLRFVGRNALTFQASVVTQRRFPYACRAIRRDTLFVGYRLNPVNSSEDTSSSGAPNVVFVQLLPLASPHLIACLRADCAGACVAPDDPAECTCLY